jgi:3D (Asp-Asp-Asp) domain-containing protein
MRTPDLRWLRHVSRFGLALLMVAAAWEAYLFFYLRTVIVVDGRRITFYAKPNNVHHVLAQKNITLGKNDIVMPPPYAAVPRHGTIRVVRVREEIQETEEVAPFRVIWKKRMKQNLRPVELQKGIQKRQLQKLRTVYHDGKEKERKVVKDITIKKTMYRLVLLNEDGAPEKTYDLSTCKKMRMIATAYYPGDPLAWKDGTETFLGLKMQRGIVAVDPRVIPLRTRVYVPEYGYGFAGDTGSAIKKKRIDLGVNNAQEEKPWMHRPVTVYILEEAKSW